MADTSAGPVAAPRQPLPRPPQATSGPPVNQRASGLPAGHQAEGFWVHIAQSCLSHVRQKFSRTISYMVLKILRVTLPKPGVLSSPTPLPTPPPWLREKHA